MPPQLLNAQAFVKKVHNPTLWPQKVVRKNENVWQEQQTQPFGMVLPGTHKICSILSIQRLAHGSVVRFVDSRSWKTVSTLSGCGGVILGNCYQLLDGGLHGYSQQ